MKIIEKINAKSLDLFGSNPVTIAFLGDSVTQGCFEAYTAESGEIDTVYDSEYGYHAHLRKLLSTLYPKTPLNIINAGISGDTAGNGANRLERDVLRFTPDLCVVCFGLNDCCVPHENAINDYQAALTQIFTRLQQYGVEAIFMTPNMMCTKVDRSITDPTLVSTAKMVAEHQTSGRLEAFLEAGKAAAKALDIPICDCYAKWQNLAKAGVDTDRLLSNRINHPSREMNRLFAVSLLETMFE